MKRRSDGDEMPELKVEISTKAKTLLEEFKENSGLATDERVIEEAIFTIKEMLELANTRSKTDTNISAERFLGVLSTFTRFSSDKRY